ncbi:MAG: metallophosphoesterase [Hyphomicrobium sp.]
MTFTFLHTADWQIGKRFGAFDGDKPAVLRDQRLQAVDRLAQAATAGGCGAVLVAGDVFDAETLSPSVSGQLLARLKAHAALTWHLLPGNHDPARAGGVWDGIAGDLPANVRAHLKSGASEIAPGVLLLSAPLASKRVSGDPTAFMDEVPSPEGVLRIGLAHGSVQGFGSAGEASVSIDPGRAKSARLDYLALGDWHGTTRISDRVWYSGTPEPDGFRDNDPGNALIVHLGGGEAVRVERVPTGHFTWLRREQRLDGAASLSLVEAEVQGLGGLAARTLMALELSGSVSLAAFAQVEERLQRLARHLFHLAADTRRVTTYADRSDLEALGSGALGDIAGRLRAAAEGGGEEAKVADRALRRLFFLARQTQAEGRP